MVSAIRFTSTAPPSDENRRGRGSRKAIRSSVAAAPELAPRTPGRIQHVLSLPAVALGLLHVAADGFRNPGSDCPLGLANHLVLGVCCGVLRHLRWRALGRSGHLTR